MGSNHPFTSICGAGTVPNLTVVLEILGVESHDFAFISGLKFEKIKQAEWGAWISVKERERILETVVVLKRQQQEKTRSELVEENKNG